ncbi:MAG: EpsG family protein [Ruminococcus sp.]|nr:EpsG family protein [Ruminococcus sp.]
MTAYYILIALIFGLAVPTCFIRPTDKKKILYVCCCFGFMLLMISFRYATGNDYNNYRRYLYSAVNNNMSVKDIVNSYSFEWGYSALMYAAGKIFPPGCVYLALNIACALLTLVPAACTIMKYSKMPWLSAWLYVAITILYNGMNFTRQSIAAAIVFSGYGFFVNRKHLGVLAVILMGALFHYSVLIMIPVYIVSLIKPKPLFLGIVGGCALLVFIFSRQLLEFTLTKFFPKYAHYLDTIYLTRGLSPKFLIVPLVMLIIIMTAFFLGMKNNGQTAQIHVWFIFINFLIWLFIVKHFIVERFTLPMYIFTLISLPEALDFYRSYCGQLAEELKNSMKEKKKRKGGSGQSTLKIKKLMSKYLFGGVTAVSLAVTFWYNYFCVGEGVHGVFPYKSLFYPMWIGRSEVKEKLDKNPGLIYVNLELTEFSYLMKSNNYTVVAAVNGANRSSMEFMQESNLRKIGMDEYFDCTDGESFIGVYSGKKAVFERSSSEEQISETFSLYDGKYLVKAVSSGENAEGQASLTVNGFEFVTSPESGGVFFLVFDNDSQKLKASQGYASSTIDCNYIHSNGFNGLYYQEGFEDLEPVYD